MIFLPMDAMEGQQIDALQAQIRQKGAHLGQVFGCIVDLPQQSVWSGNKCGAQVAFIYLSFAHIPERPDGDEAEVLETHEINVHYVAAMLFFIVFGDNGVRWIDGSETSYWFWLFSGKVEVLAAFGVLSVLALFAYWLRLGRVLKTSN